MEKPLLIYDGDCGFCRRCVERWKKATGGRVRCAPYQEMAHEFPDIPLSAFEEAVHLVEGERITRGAEAILRMLRYGGRRLPLFLYENFPGFASLSEFLYRLIAKHRQRATCTTRQQ